MCDSSKLSAVTRKRQNTAASRQVPVAPGSKSGVPCDIAGPGIQCSVGRTIILYLIFVMERLIEEVKVLFILGERIQWRNLALKFGDVSGVQTGHDFKSHWHILDHLY